MDSNKSVEDRLPGNGQLAKIEPAELRPVRPNANLANREESSLFTATNFGQSVVFQQSQVWSRAIVWGIMGITAALVTWACFARIEEAVPAQGKLEPLTDVKKVQAPISGVVKKVYVKNGDKVKTGDLLVQLESSVPESQLSSLSSTKAALEEENRFYRSQLSATANAAVPKNVNIKPEVLSLTKNRNALAAENRGFRTELYGGNSSGMTTEEQNRLRNSQAVLNASQTDAKSEILKIEEKKKETLINRQGLVAQVANLNNIVLSLKSGMEGGRARLNSELAQVEKQMLQNRARLVETQQSLISNRTILEDIKPAAAQGALSRVQVSRQEQEVNKFSSQLEQQTQEQGRLQIEKQRLLSANSIEMQNQQQRLQEQRGLITQRTSEIYQVDKSLNGLEYSARQAQAKLSQNFEGSKKDLYNRVSENDKRIAEIDSQINKVIVENEKKITEIGSQLTQAGQNLKYQEIRSPADGTVFELKAFNEGTINNNSSEPVLQIVPDNNLIAKVFITNKDIGFVKKDLPVDVRIDSFPFSEFGDVKGTLEWIGSDALPPDQTFNYYRFPARIKLDKQSLNIKHGGTSKDIQLQTGMSINANIKLRDRTIMSIFTEMFTRQSDSLKNVR